MESKETQINKNKAKIESLTADYNDLFSQLRGAKSMELFRSIHNQVLTIGQKIHVLKRKNEFLELGQPSHGWADHHENYNFLE